MMLDRIKRNVEKMIDQGAPEADIDQYLAGEGLTPEQFANANRQPTDQSFLSGLTNEAAAGITIGLADYAGAASGVVSNAVKAAVGDEQFDPSGAFSDRLGQIRADRAQFQEENPKSAIAANIAGGAALAPQIAGKMVQGAQKVLPNILPKFVKTGAGLVAGGAVEGAAFGGLEADPGQNLEGAQAGAMIGATLGVTIPGALYLGGLAAKKTIGPLASRLWARLTGNQPIRPEERELLKAIEADQATPAEVEARLRTLGPDAMIADTGENVRGLAETLANEPGTTKSTANRVLEQRQLGQSARLAQSAEGNLGVQGDFHGRIEELTARRARSAAPLYEEAFAIGPVTSPRIKRLIADPIAKKGINQGLEIQRIEAAADGVKFDPKDYAIKVDDAGNPVLDEAGDVVIEGTPNIRLLDAAKRGLDEIIDKARDGTTGRINWTQRLRAIDKLRRSLLDELDNLTGGPDGPYARARAAYAGPSQSMDTMRQGRRFMRGDPEVTAQVVQDMDPGQREFFREGVFQELQHKLGSVPENRDQAMKLLRTPNTREALKAVFPTARSYRQFMAQAMRERTFNETRNKVVSNSATARRLAGQEKFGIDPSPMIELATGHPVRATLSLVKNLLNSAKNMPEAQKNRLGRMLLSQDRETQTAALSALQSRLKRGQISQATWEALRNLVVGETAQAAGHLQGRP